MAQFRVYRYYWIVPITLIHFRKVMTEKRAGKGRSRVLQAVAPGGRGGHQLQGRVRGRWREGHMGNWFGRKRRFWLSHLIMTN